MRTPNLERKRADLEAYLKANAVTHLVLALSFFRRKDREEEAEEAIQDSTLEAYESLEEMPAALDAWFRAILVRNAETRRRARHRFGERHRRLSKDPAREPGYLPEHLNETARTVAEVVAELPEEYGEAVRAVRLEGRTVPESASLLGTPERTLHRRLKEADRLLVPRLKSAFPELIE